MIGKYFVTFLKSSLASLCIKFGGRLDLASTFFDCVDSSVAFVVFGPLDSKFSFDILVLHTCGSFRRSCDKYAGCPLFVYYINL